MGHETEEDIKRLEEMERELTKKPSNIEMLLKMGMFLCEPFHDYDAALPYFEKAVKLGHNNPDVLFWAGHFFYQEMFDYRRAKKLFERVLELDPGRAAECYCMLFYVLWKMTRDVKMGLHYLIKAIELQPEWFFPREQYITYLIGRCEFGEAVRELDMAYEVLEKYYKDGYVKGINPLEQYSIDHSNGEIYKNFKRSLDYMKEELEEKMRKAGQ